MNESPERAPVWNRPQMWLGALFLASSFLLDLVSKNCLFLRPGIRVAYPYLGSWLNIVLPIAAFYLALTGLILLVFGLKNQAGGSSTSRHRFLLALLIPLLVTTAYAAFYLGTQFLATGSDGTGECPNLIQAADTAHVIPPSAIPVGPQGPAVGCAGEKYGVFLSHYYDLSVYGVTTRAAQDRVLHGLSSFKTARHIGPIHIAFYEKQN